MNKQAYEVIIIGSGAGGAAAAYSLVKAGRRVLLLEKGGQLPRDGSTLDVKQVFAEGCLKNQRPWVDNQNRQFIPALTIYAWGLRLGDHLTNGELR